MKERPKTTSHNYIGKILSFVEKEKIDPIAILEGGGVGMFNCQHDDWCNIYEGGYCNCDPDISLKILVDERDVH